MKKLIWKIRYVIHMYWLIGGPIKVSWQCADAAWDMHIDFPVSPRDAVLEEISCWGN